MKQKKIKTGLIFFIHFTISVQTVVEPVNRSPIYAHLSLVHPIDPYLSMFTSVNTKFNGSFTITSSFKQLYSTFLFFPRQLCPLYVLVDI